jgi:hypothetical protein
VGTATPADSSAQGDILSVAAAVRRTGLARVGSVVESTDIATPNHPQEPTMNAPRLIAAPQQLLSFGLAVLFTATVLLSLGAQADERHADAMAQSGPAAASAQLCAVQPGAERS